MEKSIQLLLFLMVISFSSLSAQCDVQVTSVTSDLGEQTVYTCPQDGNADVVPFHNDNSSSSNYVYVITDNNFNILEIVNQSSFDFEPAPPGTCFVWGFSYTGNITGQAGDLVFNTQFSDECWLISRNAIRIERNLVDGGTVATPTGDAESYACLGDGIPDYVGFTNTSTSGARYRYVITDESNNILGLPGTSFLDFSGAGPGVCRVWGLSYTGNFIAELGMNAATSTLSDNCFELSSNYINVVRNEVDGGSIAMPSGAIHRSVCTLDGSPDIVMFDNTSSSSADYAYAISDVNNNILAITHENEWDFDIAPTGTCRIWGFSYTGGIKATPGESVFSTLFSEGCWEISSTAITITRTGVDGGTVAMPSGATTRYTCPGDGNADVVMFTHETSTSDVSYKYVITDEQNVILGLPPANSQDFEGAGEGVCRVWGLAYTGNFTAQPGDNAATINLSDACFSLSDNFINIIRSVPDGGTVESAQGETMINTIPGDGVDDVIEFASVGASASNFAYVITDDQNNILGLPPGNSQNFEGAGEGICRVWGLSYTGNIIAQLGDNAASTALSDGCFDLSDNFITVVREIPPLAPSLIGNLQIENELDGGSSIQMNPNPASDRLIIKMKIEDHELSESTSIRLFSIEGQLLFYKVFVTYKGENEFQLDLSDLSNGIYQVIIRNNEFIESHKLVKTSF